MEVSANFDSALQRLNNAELPDSALVSTKAHADCAVVLEAHETLADSQETSGSFFSATGTTVFPAEAAAADAAIADMDGPEICEDEARCASPHDDAGESEGKTSSTELESVYVGCHSVKSFRRIMSISMAEARNDNERRWVAQRMHAYGETEPLLREVPETSPPLRLATRTNGKNLRDFKGRVLMTDGRKAADLMSELNTSAASTEAGIDLPRP